VSMRVEKVMNACVIDNISFGKFTNVVAGSEGNLYLQFLKKLDHVFLGKRMLETHLMVTSLLLCTPYSSFPAEVIKCLFFS